MKRFCFCKSCNCIISFSEEILNDFTQTRDAWQHCLFYLANTHNEYVMMFCMTAIEVFYCFSKSLPIRNEWLLICWFVFGWSTLCHNGWKFIIDKLVFSYCCGVVVFLELQSIAILLVEKDKKIIWSAKYSFILRE